NLVAGDNNSVSDVFVHDRTSGVTERVSVDSTGVEADDSSLDSQLAQNGACVVFSSLASNLVAGDANGQFDCFARDRFGAAWSNYGAGFPGTNGVPAFTPRANPILGTTVTLDLVNSYGTPTAGAILVGFQRASLPTRLGGDLLVVPNFIVPI